MARSSGSRGAACWGRRTCRHRSPAPLPPTTHRFGASPAAPRLFAPTPRVRQEGANRGPGPVPRSKVPQSGGTGINYQPQTLMGEKKGDQSVLIFPQCKYILIFRGASSPPENRWLPTRRLPPRLRGALAS